MKAQGIYSAFTVSIFIHALIIAAAVIATRHSNINKLPAPYIVSLVSDFPAPEPASNAGNATVAPQPVVSPKTEAKIKTPEPRMHEPAPDRQKKNIRKEEEKRVSDMIAALQAKKKIEKMVAMKKIVEIGGQKSGTGRRGLQQRTRQRGLQASAGNQQSAGSDYYSKIVDKIKQQWIFPESLDKDLEAVISIRIAKDGSVTIEKIEKSSGNALFDRSVLRAITKAGSLPQPPQDMEIGVRFKP